MRFMPRSKGAAFRIEKKTSHIDLFLAEREPSKKKIEGKKSEIVRRKIEDLSKEDLAVKKEKVEKEPVKEVTPNEIGLWKEKLLACQSLGGCQVLWPTIPLAIQKNAEIIKAKEDLKKKFAEPFIQPAVVAA